MTEKNRCAPYDGGGGNHQCPHTPALTSANVSIVVQSMLAMG
jgi:hypothetical protein